MLLQRIIGIQTLCLVGALTGCSSEEPEAAGTDAGADTGAECDERIGGLSLVLDPSPPEDPINGIDWQATGRIAEKAGSSFTLDTCHPDAECAPTLTVVTVTSTPKPYVQWPIGAYVAVRYVSDAGMIPTGRLSVRNVGSWEGKTNPVSDSNRWYLIATDGFLTHPDAPFEIDSVGVDGCPQNFAMRVRAPGGDWTTLLQGESTSMVIENWQFDLTVARARQAPGHDQPLPFAWWATSTPVE